MIKNTSHEILKELIRNEKKKFITERKEKRKSPFLNTKACVTTSPVCDG